MDDTIIAAMERELAQLEAKAMAIRAVVALYRNGGVSPVSKIGERHARPIHKLQNEGSGIAGAVIAFARELCGMAEGPVPTRDVMEYLTGQGVEINAAVPQNVVSSILSRSDEFRSNGRSGWTLVSSVPTTLSPNENDPSRGDTAGKATPNSGGGWGANHSPSTNPFAEDADDSEIPF